MLRDLIQGMQALRKGQDDPEERYRDSRQVVRMRCLYEVEYQVGEGSSCPGQVVDIGLGGMKLRCSEPPQVGELVEVCWGGEDSPARYPSVPCRAEWVRSREQDGALFVGLTYEASNELLGQSWVKVLLKELGFRPERTFQRRRFLRAEGLVPVRAKEEGNGWFEGTLCNLGVQGALIEAPCSLDPGTTVQLQVGPFEALEPFGAAGVVAQHSALDQHHLLGIRFDDMSDEAVEILGRYLRHLLLNHWDV